MQAEPAPETGSVIVVGAGAVGLTVAHSLLEHGASVTVLEAGGRAGEGASDGNAGLLSGTQGHPLTGWKNIRTGLSNMFDPLGPFRLHVSPKTAIWLLGYVWSSRAGRVAQATDTLRRLCRRGVKLHRELATSGTTVGFTEHGVMVAARSSEDLEAMSASIDDHPEGARAALLDPLEMADRGVTVQGQAGAIFGVEDAHTDGQSYIQSMARAVEHRGGEVATKAEVTSLLGSSRRIHGVELANGETRWADHVVVAAGVSTRTLAKQAGLALPIIGGKGYSVDLEPGEGDPAVPVLLKNDAIAVTPYPDRIRIAGVLEVGAEDAGVDERRIEGMITAAARAIPALEGRGIIRTWSGVRCCTADGLPIIGRVVAAPGLTIATGHGQQGLVLAPTTAEIVAAEICGGNSVLPAWVRKAVSPQRFVSPVLFGRRQSKLPKVVV